MRAWDRRFVLQGLAGATALAASAARSGEMSPPPAFLALGDWGRNGDRHQSAVAEAMAQAASEVGSRFVVSVGDNFYPAGVQSADDPQWRTSFEDVYAAASLQTPWFAALGNHDYRGKPHAQVEYGRRGERWRMPDRSYVATSADTGIPDLDLFVLDTTPFVGDEDEAIVRGMFGRFSVPDPHHQLAWFRTALARSQAPWKIVVGHHPLYSGGHHGGSPALIKHLEPLFQAHGVQAYLFGHDHTLQHIQVAGTAHICTGAGASAGAVRDLPGTRFRYDQPGFAMLAFEDRLLRLEFRDAANRSVYRAAIARS